MSRRRWTKAKCNSLMKSVHGMIENAAADAPYRRGLRLGPTPDGLYSMPAPNNDSALIAVADPK